MSWFESPSSMDRAVPGSGGEHRTDAGPRPSQRAPSTARAGRGDAGPRSGLRSDVNVLIIEEQEVIRRGLLAIASSIPGVSASAVPAVAADHTQGISVTDVTLISTSTLVNLERTGLAVEDLRPVIVIVPAPQPQLLEIATQRPANGYLMQPELSAESLGTAITQVLDGQLAIHDTVATHLLQRKRDTGTALLSRLAELSPRELEVLTFLVAGASNKEIAGKLGISIHGVKRHVSALLNQFHSPSRAHLVSHLLRSGVLKPGELDTG